MSHDDDRSPSKLFEEIVGSFEQAWQRGESPAIDDYLVPAGSLRRELLVELVHIDLEYRLRAGQAARVEDYFARYAELQADSQTALEFIAAECKFRSAESDDLHVDEYVRRFPQYSNVLQARLREILCSNHETILMLGKCRHFAFLSSEVTDLLHAQMALRQFAKGESLVRQGSPETSLMLICDGIAEVFTEVEGKRQYINRVGPGELIGEMSLLTNEPCSANVTALSPIKALALSTDKFHEFARQRPEISMVLTQLVAKRLGGRGRDVLAGKVLSGYRIGNRLGRGGMGIVYEAQETSSGQRVALKMMSHRLVYDSEALARFQQEADIIELFEHANIVRHLGRFAAFHSYFLVMEFCDGETLNATIQRNGLFPLPEFRKVLGQLSLGLAYAQSHGIVHHDLKPSNIMVDLKGRVKLMDFGLAEPVADDHAKDSGRIVGTPAYMAPEQLAGEKTDYTADWYSLGCVAHEMLVGQPFLDVRNIPNGNLNELKQRYRNWKASDIRKLRSDVTLDICEILESCLKLNPAKRKLDFVRLAGWAGPVDTNLLGPQMPEAAAGTTKTVRWPSSGEPA